MTKNASPSATAAPDEEVTGGVSTARAALAVQRAPDLAAEILRQSGVPGMAVAIVHDDAVVFAGGFGVREVGKGEPVDADTVFQLASVSKSLAASVEEYSSVTDWETPPSEAAPALVDAAYVGTYRKDI